MRRRTIITAGSGDSEVKIYTLHRKDGYSSYQAVWYELRQRKSKTFAKMEAAKLWAQQVSSSCRHELPDRRGVEGHECEPLAFANERHGRELRGLCREQCPVLERRLDVGEMVLRVLARPCRVVPGVDEFARVVFAARTARLERPRHEPTFAGFDQFARFEIRAVIIERDADGGESLADHVARFRAIEAKRRERQQLEARLEREKQFNRKVELTAAVRDLQSELDALAR